MTSVTEHNGISENERAEVITHGLLGEPAVPGGAPTIAELRAEAERLINTAGRPVRRVSLRAGESTLEVDWETPPEAPSSAVGQGTERVLAADLSGPVEDQSGSAPYQVTAPLVGTVYLSPEPGAAQFVRVGDTVTAGQQLAIIEAMKLMNPIVADRDGVVTGVRVEDGKMAEFGEVLFELSSDDDQGGE